MNVTRRLARSLTDRPRPWAGGAVLVVGLLLGLWFSGAASTALHAVGLISSPGAAPANDAFASATPITGDGFGGSTAGATAETGEPGGVGADDETVWFTWTPTDSGWADLAPDATAAPAIRVYTGTALDGLTRVDQPDGNGNGTSVPALAGVTYSVQVDSPAAAGQAFHVEIVQSSSGPPGNDALAAARPLDSAVAALAAGHGPATLASGSTVGATAEPGEPAVAGQPAASSVWYSFTEPAPGGTVTLTPTVLAGLSAGALRTGVWTGTTVADVHPVAGVTAGPVTFTATAGTRYLVSVDGPQTYFDLTGQLAGLAAPDTTPPLITCTPPTGWVKASATIPCTASDAGSGLASAGDATFTLSLTAAAGQESAQVASTSHRVCDTAGNCATAGPYTNVKVDDAPPSIDCAPSPTAWSSADVTVECHSQDGGAGLAHAGDGDFTLATSVPAGTVAAAATFGTHAPVCDAAGNCTPVPTAAPVKVDRQAPAVSCAAAPSGWQKGDATIACTASDGTGAGLADPKLASFHLDTTVGSGGVDAAAHTDTIDVCDAAGNCTTAGPIGPIQVDGQPPVVSCPTPSGPAPGGWTKGDTETVTCTASDAASGLANPAQTTVTLTATIAAGTQSDAATTNSVPVCDTAGNCTTAGPVGGLRLDDQPPTITCAQPTAGWQQDVATVACTSVDPGSGLADAADATVALTVTTPAGTVAKAVPYPTKQVCDLAGNCATTPSVGTADLDGSAPQVTCSAPPAGVSAINVTFTCTATDDGSGLADPHLATFTLSTTVGDGQSDAAAKTATAQVCDVAGNCVTAGPLTADVDRTQAPPAGPPTISLPNRVVVLAGVAAPAAGAPAVSVPVPYDVPSARGGAGNVTVSCEAAPGAVFVVGNTPVGCNALDQADQHTDGWFWLQVQDEPGLAPSGPAVPGAGWRAVGADYAPGSGVTIELDGSVIGRTSADGSGLVDFPFTFPSPSDPGQHVLVVRGQATDGSAVLVVTPVAVGGGATATTSTTTPTGPTTTAPAAPTTTVPVSSPTTLPPAGGGPTTTAPGSVSGPSGGAGQGTGPSGGQRAGQSGGAAVSPAGAGGTSTGSGGETAAGPLTTVAPLAPGAPAAPAGNLPGLPAAPAASPQQSAAGGPNVSPAVTSPAPAGSTWPWWLLAAALAVAAAVTAVVIARRRGVAPPAP
jgi:hypothetical protein